MKVKDFYVTNLFCAVNWKTNSLKLIREPVHLCVGGGGNWKPFPKSSASKFLIQGHSIHCCDLKRHNSSERQNEKLIVSQQQTKSCLYDGQCIANKLTDFEKDLLHMQNTRPKAHYFSDKQPRNSQPSSKANATERYWQLAGPWKTRVDHIVYSQCIMGGASTAAPPTPPHWSWRSVLQIRTAKETNQENNCRKVHQCLVSLFLYCILTLIASNLNNRISWLFRVSWLSIFSTDISPTLLDNLQPL